MTKPLTLAVFIFVILAVTAWWYINDQNKQRDEDFATSLEAGISQFKAGEYQAALEQLSSISSGFSDAGRARYYEGSAHIMLKDYSAAIRALEDALQLDPRNTRILHALGVAHFKSGHLALSKAYYAKVIEIDPTDEEARGLMDIMANLERMQPNTAVKEPLKDH